MMPAKAAVNRAALASATAIGQAGRMRGWSPTSVNKRMCPAMQLVDFELSTHGTASLWDGLLMVHPRLALHACKNHQRRIWVVEAPHAGGPVLGLVPVEVLIHRLPAAVARLEYLCSVEWRLQVCGQGQSLVGLCKQVTVGG